MSAARKLHSKSNKLNYNNDLFVIQVEGKNGGLVRIDGKR